MLATRHFLETFLLSSSTYLRKCFIARSLLARITLYVSKKSTLKPMSINTVVFLEVKQQSMVMMSTGLMNVTTTFSTLKTILTSAGTQLYAENNGQHCRDSSHSLCM